MSRLTRLARLFESKRILACVATVGLLSLIFIVWGSRSGHRQGPQQMPSANALQGQVDALRSPTISGPFPNEDSASFSKSPLGTAFRKCHDMLSLNANKPDEQFHATLQAVANQLPNLELSTEPGKARWNHLQIFLGGIPFSAFRFSSTLEQPADLCWIFTSQESWYPGSWYILPACGKMNGFSHYRYLNHPAFQDPSVPINGRFFFQSLTGGEIKPGQDYIVFFARDKSEEKAPARLQAESTKSRPIPTSIALRLLPANTVSPNPQADEIAKLVGAPLASSSWINRWVKSTPWTP